MNSIADLRRLLCGSNMGVMNLAMVSYDSVGLGRKLTFVANFKLVKVSVKWASSGLAMTNMSVLELPPNEYCKR